MKSHLKVRINENMYLSYSCRVVRRNGVPRSVTMGENGLTSFLSTGQQCALEQARQTVGNLVISEVLRDKKRLTLNLEKTGD
jgi:hypothetical protein